DMVIRAMRSGRGVSSLHLAASPYFLPLERSLAASHVISNQGWFSSNWMKRWPTIPVAPRMPMGCLLCMAVDIPVYRNGESEKGDRDRGSARRDQAFNIRELQAGALRRWKQCGKVMSYRAGRFRREMLMRKVIGNAGLGVIFL